MKSMAVIKITKKDKLDQLVARITLELGSKATQQDVLDAVVEIAEEHFDELKSKLSHQPLLDDEKVNRILASRDKLSKIPWRHPSREDYPNDEDADIYPV